MKSLKDHISVQPTHRRFQDDFSTEAQVSIQHDSCEAPHQYGMGLVEEHKVQVEIGVSFCCNSVELPYAEADARKQLIHVLYKEQLMYTHRVRNAINSGNRRDAREALDELIQSMSP